MTSIIDDFKDIASRMKGELAPKRKEAEPKASEDMLKASLPKANWRSFNPGKLGSPVTPVNMLCPKCQGSGTDLAVGLDCIYCSGKGFI